MTIRKRQTSTFVSLENMIGSNVVEFPPFPEADKVYGRLILIVIPKFTLKFESFKIN